MKIRKGTYTRLDGYTLNQIYAAALCYGLVQSLEFEPIRTMFNRHSQVFMWDKDDHSPRQAYVEDVPDDYVEIKVDTIINNMARYLHDLDIERYK